MDDAHLSLYRYLIEQGDASRWALGDQLAEDAPLYPTLADLYREVSKAGEKIQTLKQTHWLSGLVPPVLRQRYPLTRAQWRACAGWAVLVEDREERIDRMEEMAEWTCAYAEATGQVREVATVQVIEMEVKRRKLVDKLEVYRGLSASHGSSWEYAVRLKVAERMLEGEVSRGHLALARVLAME